MSCAAPPSGVRPNGVRQPPRRSPRGQKLLDHCADGHVPWCNAVSATVLVARPSVQMTSLSGVVCVPQLPWRASSPPHDATSRSAGITATQAPQRAAAYGSLQDLLIDESSAFPVYERVWQAATSPKVKNFRWTAEGFALLGDIEVGTP